MRLKRIDAFRVSAIYIIIWAHCQFFDGIKPEGGLATGIELGVNLLVRSSMQFFFIITGLFVGGKMVREPDKIFSIAWDYSKKILLVFLIWSFIYALEDPQSVLNLARKDPISLLFGGTRIHLWFLMSIMLTIWVFAIWPLDKKGYSFLVFGGILFLIGLLSGSYMMTPIGFNMHFNSRNAIFFSTVFFSIGVLISIKQLRLGMVWSWILYFAGGLLFAVESYILWANWNLLPIRHDYLLGSLPYGIGVFFLAYNAKRETGFDKKLAPYAKYVLGIYVAHLLVLDLLNPLGEFINPIAWAFLYPALVFGLTLTGVILLSKTPLRSLVV